MHTESGDRPFRLLSVPCTCCDSIRAWFKPLFWSCKGLNTCSPVKLFGWQSLLWAVRAFKTGGPLKESCDEHASRISRLWNLQHQRSSRLAKVGHRIQSPCCSNGKFGPPKFLNPTQKDCQQDSDPLDTKRSYTWASILFHTPDGRAMNWSTKSFIFHRRLRKSPYQESHGKATCRGFLLWSAGRHDCIRPLQMIRLLQQTRFMWFLHTGSKYMLKWEPNQHKDPWKNDTHQVGPTVSPVSVVVSVTTCFPFGQDTDLLAGIVDVIDQGVVVGLQLLGILIVEP